MLENLIKKHIKNYVIQEFEDCPRDKIALRNLTQEQIENEFCKDLRFIVFVFLQEIKNI